jgi:large-conductance mechanosensitive channel
MTLLTDAANPMSALPSWDMLTRQYGPFLGALVFFIIIAMVLQFFWYKENLKSKDAEILRSVKRTTELESLITDLIKQLRGPKK